jgi:hypothetical protein
MPFELFNDFFENKDNDSSFFTFLFIDLSEVLVSWIYYVVCNVGDFEGKINDNLNTLLIVFVSIFSI